MKRTLITLAACLTLVLGAGFATVWSESAKIADEKAEPTPAYTDEAGAEHKLLASHVGNWIISGSFNDMKTGKPVTVTGEATVEAILGDRFLYETNNITADKLACQGRGFLGYSNSAKAYQALFISEKFTGMQVMDGQYDAELEAIVFTGSKLNPLTNKTQNVRVVLTMKDDDKHVIEFFCSDVTSADPARPSPPSPKLEAVERKEGELIYTRK